MFQALYDDIIYHELDNDSALSLKPETRYMLFLNEHVKFELEIQQIVAFSWKYYQNGKFAPEKQMLHFP